MNILRKIKFICSLTLAVFLSNACTEDFEELNTPSDLITEDVINVNLLFTRVEQQAVVSDSPNGRGTIGNYSGISVSGANRPFQDGTFDDVWNDTYITYTNNLAYIIRLTQDDPELVNKKAIARILKVWAFARATDIYGDIPYFESNLPQDEAIFTPQYDTQESIYRDFFKELKEAAAELDPTMESYGSADLIYQGDIEKWRKFANSLRLRLALRVRYADEQLAKENMSDLQESDLITSREDDAYIMTSTDLPENQNDGYNSVINSGASFNPAMIGKTLLDAFHDNNDPRTKLFADTAKAEFPAEMPDVDYFGYRGHPLLGLVPVEEKYPYGYESVSRLSSFWFVPVIERPLLRSSEVYFALAEASLFGLRSGDAQEYYRKGIEAGIQWAQEFYEMGESQLPEVLKIIHPEWTDEDINKLLTHKAMTAEEIDTFLASPTATLSGSQEVKLEQIMTQKLIVLYPMEYQAWAEWRRTGYPRVLVGSDDDDLQGTIPRKQRWPDTEMSVNSQSYQEALSRIGGEDGKLIRVWWDANPNVPYKHPGEVEKRDEPWVTTDE
ncbi:hypothetical protein OKW21_001509 [Catalinimonas alkaloidigena]|uniref:SusD/RagB family nutrient-binding outer membrane lipoprotein n=1 Tax=Catalinimonas alkaloidigena TaxID=1075417 RepID=UPI002407411C|nr:SusD/RagB family nutrient-binding outer membrane lipoprotein [Catalinimonas alkaloidigena]MDF9796246.1 hypothetical protein [Catalinimonas alkaloidigena]